MKFSIITIALFAAISSKASPIPDTEVASDSVRNEDASTLSTVNSIPDAPLVVYTSAVTDHVERQGTPCAAGLKVYGFARVADYFVPGHDYSGDDLTNLYKEGKFDNYGGPIIAGALARAPGALPGTPNAFVQSQNANYFWHKTGDVSSIISSLIPDARFATYIAGTCDQFADGSDLYAHCCQ